MTKRALSFLISGVVVVAAVAAVLAFTLTGGDSSSHSMPDGSTMENSQPMHTMSNGSTMDGETMGTAPSHTMSDGSTMDGETMRTATAPTHTMSDGSAMDNGMDMP